MLSSLQGQAVANTAIGSGRKEALTAPDVVSRTAMWIQPPAGGEPVEERTAPANMAAMEAASLGATLGEVALLPGRRRRTNRPQQD
mmetsp:Transcript_46480/g.135412  ORF Transcript_46480/g.135412 Transcript_46480/m.135412 type:complete len:86 (-) Transcript_46480:920-1177(-)